MPSSAGCATWRGKMHVQNCVKAKQLFQDISLTLLANVNAQDRNSLRSHVINRNDLKLFRPEPL